MWVKIEKNIEDASMKLFSSFHEREWEGEKSIEREQLVDRARETL